MTWIAIYIYFRLFNDLDHYIYISSLFNDLDQYIYISVCSMTWITIYIFQAVHRAVNVIKLMFLHVSKYQHDAIFHNVNINSQRANVTGSQ